MKEKDQAILKAMKKVSEDIENMDKDQFKKEFDSFENDTLAELIVENDLGLDFVKDEKRK